MRLFISSLSSSDSVPITDISFGTEIAVDLGNQYRSGGYILGSTCLYFNGNYYGTGQSTVDTGERGIIWKWNPTTEVFTYDEIYGVFSQAEAIQHRFPSIIITNDGYIYCAATDPHGSTIRVYRSDNTEDITGFTEVSNTGTSGGTNAYPSLYLDGNDLVISHRNTGTTSSGAGNIEFVHGLWRATIGVWSWNRINLYENTDGSAGLNRRVVYPTFPKQLVNNNWVYFISNPRSGDGGSEQYFSQVVLKTQDYNTFYNLEGTWSKNIVANGIITIAERPNITIRDNGAGKGVGLQMISIVNDIFVGYYYDWDAGKHYIQWYDGAWNTRDVQALLDPLYGYDGGIDGIYKMGNYYYYFSVVDSNLDRKIYRSEIPFNTFEEVHDLGNDATSTRLSSRFPSNVITEQKSLLIGSNGTGTMGDGYNPTTLKYNIVIFK